MFSKGYYFDITENFAIFFLFFNIKQKINRIAKTLKLAKIQEKKC